MALIDDLRILHDSGDDGSSITNDQMRADYQTLVKDGYFAKDDQSAYVKDTAKNIIPDALKTTKDIAGLVTSDLQGREDYGWGPMLSGMAGGDMTAFYKNPISQNLLSIGKSMLAENPNIPEDDISRHIPGGIGNIPRNLYEMAAHPILGKGGETPSSILEAGRNLKSNFKERPIGTALEMVPVAGRLSKTGQALQESGKFGGLGTAMKGLGDVPKTIGAGLLSPVKSAGEAIYGTALNFKPDVGFIGRENAIRAGASKGLIPTKKGFTKLNKTVSELYNNLDDVLTKSTKAGKRVQLDDIVAGRDALLENARWADDAVGVRKKINKMFDAQVNEAKRSGRDYLTPKEANKLKIGLNKSRDFKWMSPDEGADVATSKLATNLKTELEKINPNIEKLNAEMAPLLTLRDALYGEAFRGGNVAHNAISKANLGNRILGPIGSASGLIGPTAKTQLGSGLVRGAGLAEKAAPYSTLMEILAREREQQNK